MNFDTTYLPMQTGLHIVGELYTEDSTVLTDLNSTKPKISSAISKVGFNQVGFTGYSFEGGGYTLVFLLAESHVSVHTWPEYGYATLDVFVCNVTKNNSDCAIELFDIIVKMFDPIKLVKRSLLR